MSGIKGAFSSLQKIGKSLMLPVSVLPAAGILLGVGSAKFTWLPAAVSDCDGASWRRDIRQPRVDICDRCRAWTRQQRRCRISRCRRRLRRDARYDGRDGAASRTTRPTPIMGIPSIETGVFGGILIGSLAAILFNRFYRIQLPPYLGFFSGKRSVPIITAGVAVVTGIILAIVWPPIGDVINRFSRWAAAGNPAAAFALYGVVERSLIPFGLHHIWNVPFFFEVGQYVDPVTHQVIRGEINRFVCW